MIYTIENDKLRVEINSKGAELWSVYNKQDGIEHLWQGDATVWGGRAPTLFPNCGRLKGNRYIIDGQTYGSKIHGFARDYEHSVIQRDQNSITFLFSDNEETLKKYPYHFRLYTIFQLKDNKLVNTFEIENVSDGEMFFSIGFHTGYRIPFDDHHSLEDYSIVFEKEESPVEILSDEDVFLTGEKKVYFENEKVLPINEKLFHSIVFSELKSDAVSIVEKGTGKSIKVGIMGFPYVVFWTQETEKIRFVCIEPWFGLPDAADTDGQFSKKPAIQKLQKGKMFTCTQTIEVK